MRTSVKDRSAFPTIRKLFSSLVALAAARLFAPEKETYTLDG